MVSRVELARGRIRGRLSLQDLVAGPAALLMNPNLLVAFWTAPETTSLDSLLSRPKGHERKLLFVLVRSLSFREP